MRRPLCMMCLCLIMMIALGIRLSGYPRGEISNEFSLGENKECYVTGRVTKRDTQSFVLKISAVSSQHENPTMKYNQILCEYPRESEHSIQLGDTLTVLGTYSAFSQATNPGEFDIRQFYAAQNIGGKLKDINILYREKSPWNWQEILYQMRRKWQKRLYTVFPAKEASVMTAMLLGDKTNLDGDVKDLYKRNGTIHILSISGLHITLIGMGIYRLLRRFGLPIWLSALIGGAILCLYGVMTGMGVSTVRAILMYLIHMFAIVIGRTYDMLTALALSGVILVLWSPDNLGYAGFLLSFGAVMGIGILLPALTPKERYVPRIMETNPWRKMVKKQISKWWSGLRQSFLAGASIGLFTLPVQLWFYFEIPVYSVFLNLLILPLMSIVMVSGLFVMLLPGTGVVGTVTYLILKVYEMACTCFDRLPFRTWNPGRPTQIQVFLYYICLLLVVMGRQNNFAHFRPICSILQSTATERRQFSCRLYKSAESVRNIITIVGVSVAILILTFHFHTTNSVTFLDVGQGDGIVLELKSGEVFVIDCGSSSRTHVGQQVLIPYLKYRGINHVDGVFVSHPDKDHCNGVVELFENEEGITIGQVILPAIAEQQRDEFEEIFQAVRRNFSKTEETKISFSGGKRLAEVSENIPIKYIKTGDEFSVGQMKVVCLHPPKDYAAEDSNSYSQCLYVEIGKASFLFTGDVEGKGEQLLTEELKARKISTVSVLKAAHHGSKYSTSDELLDALHPKMAILSVGRKNSYGHPHQETVSRFLEHDVDIYRTDLGGAISVNIVDTQLQIKMYVK